MQLLLLILAILAVGDDLRDEVYYPCLIGLTIFSISLITSMKVTNSTSVQMNYPKKLVYSKIFDIQILLHFRMFFFLQTYVAVRVFRLTKSLIIKVFVLVLTKTKTQIYY